MLAVALGFGWGMPSFGRGTVFTCPREATGRSAAKASSRKGTPARVDIRALQQYCTPLAGAAVLADRRQERKRTNTRFCFSVLSQPAAFRLE